MKTETWHSTRFAEFGDATHTQPDLAIAEETRDTTVAQLEAALRLVADQQELLERMHAKLAMQAEALALAGEMAANITLARLATM